MQLQVFCRTVKLRRNFRKHTFGHVCSANIQTLRKQNYSNILKILPPKNEKFLDKNYNIFVQISAQTIDCGYSLELPRRGGSNEYPQSMFFSRNNKINVYPCKPQFCYIKWGLRGSKLYRHVFVMKLFHADNEDSEAHADLSFPWTHM